ncbi:riboflavin synthase [Patescibacteria group bacterium]|nr:riboflavin synthase [Patescibacteria group bacterium]
MKERIIHHFWCLFISPKGDFLMHMFTGIISNLGKLNNKNGAIFTFSADSVFCKKISKGTSIAINGTCLTVFKKPTKNSFSVEVMPETQNKTMLGHLKINDLVNLELPLTPQSFLSGHIVQGHIDTVSKLLSIKKEKNSRILKFFTPRGFKKYIIEKGSIAINGVSLTIIKATKNNFTVGIIPYTWDNTMFHILKPADFVNIEVDILAKYLEVLKND